MELAGHKCVGFCEWDKFATASYTSMHLITEEQRKYLSGATLKQRQRRILREEYRNGEWYADDIRRVRATDLPAADCWCFGAPCQDFSIAGKRAGLGGDRSSLIREIFRLLEEQEEENRPEWLIYENVKGMLSSNRGLDYLSILSELDKLGYDIEWQNIHSEWYVPQHRERIYTVGHLRRYGSRKILPIEGADGENSVQQLGNYLPTKTRQNPNQGRIYDIDGISPCLNSMEGGGREPSVGIKIIGKINSSQDGLVCSPMGISQCQSAGHGNCAKVAIPVLTPDRTEKRQNGRRFKEDGEPMFTLTAQDRHGVGVEVLGGVYTNVSSEYQRGICEGLSRGLKANKHDAGVAIGIVDRQGRKRKKASLREIAPTLRSETHGNLPEIVFNITGEMQKQGNGIYVELSQGFTVYAVWYEKYQCYIIIRHLTPKECFRLQGWTDNYFERAAFVNSNSQLYKQAGNQVTVSVVREIGKKIAEQTKGEREDGETDNTR